MNNIIIILLLTICVLFVNIIILYIKIQELESHAKALGEVLKMYIDKDNNKVKSNTNIEAPEFDIYDNKIQSTKNV